MDFPKPNQQMLLLLSEKNPMWRVLLDPQQLTQDNIYKITRRARNVLAKWRGGAEVKLTTCEAIFNCIQARIDWDGKTPTIKVGDDNLMLKGFRVLTNDERTTWSSKLSEYRKECQKADKSKAYVLANILTLGIEDCQKIIDGLIYETRPLFPSFYYGKDAKELARAKNDFEEIGGFYHVWARRDEVWLKAALRVRYVLNMRGGSAIRVKMNFPLFRPNRKRSYEEYDGFVIAHTAARKLYWTFEERKEIGGDYWYMITNILSVQQTHEDVVLRGTYLSTGQDGNFSVVSSDVLLVRQPNLEIEAVAALMGTTARVVRKGDPEWEVPEGYLPP